MRLPALGLFCALLVLSLPALADTYTYTYTGNPFTHISPGNSTFTTSDFVSGYFTTDAHLAPYINWNFGLHPSTLTVTSFSFSNRFQTVTNTDPNITATRIQVETDASGTLIGWNLNFDEGPSSAHVTVLEMENWFAQGGEIGPAPGDWASEDFGQNEIPLPDGSSLFDQASNHYDPGTWTVTVPPDPSPVPEPSTLFLLGTGIVGLLTTLCRKYRCLSY